MHVVQPLQSDEHHRRHQIGAVVHGDVRLVRQGGDDVFVIGVVVLFADGVDGDAEVLHETGGDIILGTERIGGDQHHLGAAGLQRADEVSRLAGDVQAGRHTQTGQRFLFGETRADAAEYRHVAIGPQNAFFALRGQFKVFYIAMHFGRRSHGHSIATGFRYRSAVFF